MTTPENRASLLAIKEESIIEKPLRTETQPSSNVHKAWVEAIDANWPQLSRAAFKALGAHEDAVLNPELVSETDLQERFQFRKSDVRLYILNMGTQSDIKAAFSFFQVGKAIETEEPRKQHEEQFYDVTRLQLLQVYVAIHALLDMSTKVGKGRRRLIGGRKKERLSEPTDKKTFLMLDKLMRQRPYKGGPLMAVRH